jgi:hypothetical protein
MQRKTIRERGPRHCASSYQFVVAVWRTKEAESAAVKYWELVADKLSKAGWSLGWVSAVDSEGRTMWIVDAGSRRRRAFRCARG